MLHLDVGASDGVHLTDGRSVLRGDGAAGPAEEDRRQGGQLCVVGALVDVEHDLPARRRLDPVEVAKRHHHEPIGEIESVGDAGVDMPREGAEALAVARRAAGFAPNAAARADRLAVAALEVRAAHEPLGWDRRFSVHMLIPVVGAG